MKNKAARLMLVLSLALVTRTGLGQSPQPYPHATTDTNIHPKTAMAPPAINTPFNDPDFGTLMVRATDENSDPLAAGASFQASSAGTDEWSRDGRKFYVGATGGGVFAYGFDPSTMAVKSLGGMKPGQGFLIPLRPGATFSRTDSDLIYGTLSRTPLTITSYRFSTNATSTVIDTTTCGTVPSLVPGPGVVSDDDVNLANGDVRVSISEGGNEFGHHMFAVVYDKKLGCRWYNTQTGEIGGQWGAVGTASTSDRYLIQHAYLSRNGRYLRIGVDPGFYVWDLATLKVVSCLEPDGPACRGYAVNGYATMVGQGDHTDLNVVKRPLSNPAQLTPLVWPLTPGTYGQEKHFTWNNDNSQDTMPMCGSAFTYYAGDVITRPYDGEIFCLETDGIASTIWRFVHHRSNADQDVFNTQPTVSVSRDGRFLLFNSNWDEQLGFLKNGRPRADMWIVKLD
jgi:hypothetical protein